MTRYTVHQKAMYYLLMALCSITVVPLFFFSAIKVILIQQFCYSRKNFNIVRENQKDETLSPNFETIHRDREI